MAKDDRKIEDYQSVLVVEGYGDLLFYAEVLERIGIHGQVYIKEFGGRSSLMKGLGILLTPALLLSKASIAVIVDADEKPGGSVAELERLLSKLTGAKVRNGAWTVGSPRIGLMVVPDGSSSGEIETLIWRSWIGDPANSEKRRCVESYVRCMESIGVPAKSPDKALVGALLAVQNDDDPRLGPGARAKVFDLDRPELGTLRAFLSGLRP